MGTHYDMLGVAPTATADEIDDRYRAIAKVVHPDLGGDATTFHVLNEAYEVLADPRARAEYDRSLAASRDARPSARPVTEQRSSFLQDSTPAERAEANRLAESGIQSWHQTPGEYLKTGAKRGVVSLALVAVYFAVRAVLRA